MKAKGYSRIEIEQPQTTGITPDLTCIHPYSELNCSIEVENSGYMAPKLEKKLCGLTQVLINGKKYNMNNPLEQIVKQLTLDIEGQVGEPKKKKIVDKNKAYRKQSYERVKHIKDEIKKRNKNDEYYKGYGL